MVKSDHIIVRKGNDDDDVDTDGNGSLLQSSNISYQTLSLLQCAASSGPKHLPTIA